MKVPTHFGDLKEEWLAIKYPAENRPPVILSTEDGSVNITLNLIEAIVCEEQIEPLKKVMKDNLKKICTGNSYFEDRIIQGDYLKIGYFDYKSIAVDEAIYNIMFITVVAQKPLVGSFNCPFDRRESWGEISIKLIKSIEDLAQGK